MSGYATAMMGLETLPLPSYRRSSASIGGCRGRCSRAGVVAEFVDTDADEVIDRTRYYWNLPEIDP